MVDPQTRPSASSERFMAADVSARKLLPKRSMDCVLNMDSVAPALRVDQLRHTYSASSVLSPRRRSADMRLVARHPDVYEPCDDSFALVDALLADRTHLMELQPRLCVEIGCGSGYVISSLALMLREEVDSHYIATDINKAATETTLETLKVHGVAADVIRTDLVSGLEKRLAGNVDLLVFNPPYVPTPEEEVGAAGIAGTWAGGDRGRAVIDRMLAVVDNIMSSRGWIYLVTLTANNPAEICRIMRSKGFASRIAVQRHTEEESLHVLKFWREHNPSSSSSSSSEAMTQASSPLLCLPQRISRLAFWRQ